LANAADDFAEAIAGDAAANRIELGNESVKPIAQLG
jgi:hypothetical protein